MAILVVPGQRVGQIDLNARRQSVINLLGQPQQTGRSPLTNLRTDTYLGSHPPNTLQRFLRIIYSGPTDAEDKVIQVEFNSPDFATSDGISTNSSIAQFRARHPNAAVSLFEYEDEDTGFTETHVFFDDTQEGIAFQLAISSEPDADENRIRVHLRNRAVLPDPGGEAGFPDETLS